MVIGRYRPSLPLRPEESERLVDSPLERAPAGLVEDPGWVLVGTAVPGTDLRSYPLLFPLSSASIFGSISFSLSSLFFRSIFFYLAGTNKEVGGFIRFTEWLCVFYYPHDVWVPFVVFECGLSYRRCVGIQALFIQSLAPPRALFCFPLHLPAHVIVVGRDNVPFCPCEPYLISLADVRVLVRYWNTRFSSLTASFGLRGDRRGNHICSPT